MVILDVHSILWRPAWKNSRHFGYEIGHWAFFKVLQNEHSCQCWCLYHNVYDSAKICNYLPHCSKLIIIAGAGISQPAYITIPQVMVTPRQQCRMLSSYFCEPKRYCCLLYVSMEEIVLLYVVAYVFAAYGGNWNGPTTAWFKAARVAQQGQLSTWGIGYFRLSAGCRQFRSWPQENIVLIRHLHKICHGMCVL